MFAHKTVFDGVQILFVKKNLSLSPVAKKIFFRHSIRILFFKFSLFGNILIVALIWNKHFYYMYAPSHKNRFKYLFNHIIIAIITLAHTLKTNLFVYGCIQVIIACCGLNGRSRTITTSRHSIGKNIPLCIYWVMTLPNIV